MLSLQFSLSRGSPATSLSSTAGSCITNAPVGADLASGPGKMTQKGLEQGLGRWTLPILLPKEPCLERGGCDREGWASPLGRAGSLLSFSRCATTPNFEQDHRWAYCLEPKKVQGATHSLWGGPNPSPPR